MTIKKGDFIELDFIGRIKDSKEIFDLTKESVARENKIFNPNFSYKPVVICVGEGELIKGLDNKLIGKDKGNFEIELNIDEGFGKKNPTLLKLLPMKIFKKENLKPFPGLNINLDGVLGTVRSVSGGRVVVDFNHPLSGKEIFFEIEVKRIIQDNKEKIESIISKASKKYELSLEKNNLNLKIDLDQKHKDMLKERILKLVPEIKEVNFQEALNMKKTKSVTEK